MTKSRKRSADAGVSSSYLEHKSILRRYLSRFLTSPDDIDDVLQETFLRAYQAEGNDARIRSPKAYLTRIARNIALKELDKRSIMVFSYLDEVASPEADASAPTEQEAAEHERIAVFCKAAASLPAQCRRAFLMCKVYGYSHREIAQELGISVSTVEKHLASGLRRCSEYMTARGYVPVRKKRVA
jgi:RNA polymerase sigma-70 factor (ECF subfamily)